MRNVLRLARKVEFVYTQFYDEGRLFHADGPARDENYWRLAVKRMVASFQLLSDDLFLKRHQKQEADEKRRKRWDDQRQRELSVLEKLVRSRKENGSETSGSEGADDPADISEGMSLVSNASQGILGLTVRSTKKLYFMLF